jgi:hypothetical protein
MPREPRPVTINGVEYRSAYAAAKALGVSRKTLEWRLRKQLPIDEYRVRSRAVIVNGTRYESMRAAAKALGVQPGSIYYRVKKFGPLFDYALPSRLRPITLDGKTYASIKAAADATGISYYKLLKTFPRKAKSMAPIPRDGTIPKPHISH